MKKADAISLFGDVRYLADTLGVSRQAIYMWPDELPSATADRVTGAALRVGIIGHERRKSRVKSTSIRIPAWMLDEFDRQQ